MGITENKWYLHPVTKKLHCKHCRLPADDRTRGASEPHSYCWVKPSQNDYGSPSRHDEPMVIARRGGSDMTGLMLSYLTRNEGAYARAMRDLRERYPRYAQVVEAHHHGDRLTKVAHDLKVSYRTVRHRSWRGEQYLGRRFLYWEEKGGPSVTTGYDKRMAVALDGCELNDLDEGLDTDD